MPKFAILKSNANQETTGISGLALPAGTMIREPEIKKFMAKTIFGESEHQGVLVTGANGKQYLISKTSFIFSDLDDPYFMTDDSFGDSRVVIFNPFAQNSDGDSVFPSADAAAEVIRKRWIEGHGLWDIRIRDQYNKIARIMDFNDIVPKKRQYYFIRYSGQKIPVASYYFGYRMYRTVTGAEEAADELNWKHGEVMEVVDRYLHVIKTVGTEHKGAIQQDIEALGRYMQGDVEDEE